MKSKSLSAMWQHSRRKLSEQIFVGEDFVRSGNFRFRDTASTVDVPIISGNITHLELQPGMSLHCVEGQDLHNNFSSRPIEPGLRIVIVLDGRVRVAFGGKWLVIDTESGDKPQSKGALVSIGETTTFGREWQRGKFERKLSIGLSKEWLAQNGFDAHGSDVKLAEAMQKPVTFHEWTLSHRMISLAEKILDHAASGGVLKRMALLGSVFEVVHDALNSLESSSHAAPSIVSRRYQKIHKVRDFLDHPDYLHLSVQEIAGIVALSQSTLQRQFKAIFGMSVDAYRRDGRLKIAHHLLEKEGLSVSQVADQVGYTSAANFSTAFKRHYGVLPKAVRSRM
jgi:AraC-like DNA-binding protein